MSEHAMLPASPEATEAAVYADVEIAAPPEEVFRALTEPEELARWWGSDDTYRTREWEVDPRPGGEWSVRTVDAAGNEASVHGEYRTVDPPRRLEYTWHASWDHFAPTVVRYDLAPAVVDGVPGTRVTVTHTTGLGITGCASAGTRGLAWTRVLRWLAADAVAGAGRAVSPWCSARRAA